MLQNILDYTRSFFIPGLSCVTKAIRMEGISETALELCLGLGSDEDRNVDQMLMLSCKDLQELGGFQHLSNGFSIKIFEILLEVRIERCRICVELTK